jgi:hypothetical protein
MPSGSEEDEVKNRIQILPIEEFLTLCSAGLVLAARENTMWLECSTDGMVSSIPNRSDIDPQTG